MLSSLFHVGCTAQLGVSSKAEAAVKVPQCGSIAWTGGVVDLVKKTLSPS